MTNKRSFFVAGWRPCLGWICVAGFAYPFIINPTLQWLTGQPALSFPLDELNELAVAMLGLAGLRTFEKYTGKTE